MSICSNCFAARRDAFPTYTLAALLFPESSHPSSHLGSFLRRREPLFRRTGKKQDTRASDMPGCILATWASLEQRFWIADATPSVPRTLLRWNREGITGTFDPRLFHVPGP
ncbi:hypothetical protein E4U13_005134 [Claviceps humidiphila]|uniref:Uncharacterized protein n=1 Tax=Claviceps humidiphila TaxID=1294629 RepID=A0A9P7U0K7_9HYPO|nr:hypothetical protein E4U13_005134 [Claviceps humidiphila]